MSEKIHFLDMFSRYEPTETLRDVLSQAAVTSAEIDQPNRSVEMTVFSDGYIAKRILDEAAASICELYGLRNLSLLAKHPSDQLQRVEPEELMSLFVDINSMTRASLAGATWSWEENILTVQLLGNGKTFVEECIGQVCRTLKDRFDTDVQIRVVANEKMDGQALFDAMEEMRRSMISELPKAGGAVEYEEYRDAV